MEKERDKVCCVVRLDPCARTDPRVMGSVNLSSLVTGTLFVTQKSVVRFLSVPGAGGGILDSDES